MKTSNTLQLLSLLHGRMILADKRIMRVYIDVKTTKAVLPKSNTILQDLFGKEPTYSEEDVEEVDKVWLIEFKTGYDSKRHLCMEPSFFIKHYILEEKEDNLFVYQINQKLREFAQLKKDFEQVYNLNPKEEMKKIPNI